MSQSQLLLPLDQEKDSLNNESNLQNEENNKIKDLSLFKSQRQRNETSKKIKEYLDFYKIFA